MIKYLATFISLSTALLLSCADGDTSQIRLVLNTLEDRQGSVTTGVGTLQVTPYDVVSGQIRGTQTFDLSARQGALPSLPIGTWKLLIEGSANNVPFYGATTQFTVDENEAFVVQALLGRANCIGKLPPQQVAQEFSTGKLSLPNGFVGQGVVELPSGDFLITGGGLLNESDGRINGVSNAIFLYSHTLGLIYDTGKVLNVGRAFHQATLLSDGQVLITGGVSSVQGGAYFAEESAELISADFTGKTPLEWSVVSQVVVNSVGAGKRFNHSATRLKDGTVLLIGGQSDNGAFLKSTSRYFPTEGIFRVQGDLNQSKAFHSVSRLNRQYDQLAVIGGLNELGANKDVEVFTTNPMASCTPRPDGNTGCFSRVAELNRPRWGHGSALIERPPTLIDGAPWVDNSVIIAGGFGSGDETTPADPLSPVELFEISNGNPSVRDNLANLSTARGNVGYTGLPDGSLILMGGRTVGSSNQVTRITPTVNTQQTPPTVNLAVEEHCQLSEGRYGAQAILNQDGAVVLIGGIKKGTNQAGVVVNLPSKAVELLYGTISPKAVWGGSL